MRSGAPGLCARMLALGVGTGAGRRQWWVSWGCLHVPGMDVYVPALDMWWCEYVPCVCVCVCLKRREHVQGL